MKPMGGASSALPEKVVMVPAESSMGSRAASASSATTWNQVEVRAAP